MKLYKKIAKQYFQLQDSLRNNHTIGMISDYLIHAKPHISLSIAIHLIVFVMACINMPSFDLYKFRESKNVVLMDLVSVGVNTNVKMSSDQQKNLYSQDSELIKPKPSAGPKVTSNESEGEKLPTKKVSKALHKKPLISSKIKKTERMESQSTLKAVKNVAKKVPLNNTPKEQKGILGKGTRAYNSAKPQTVSLVDSIRSQLNNCWSIPHGALNVENLQVKVYILLDESGNVLNARIVDIGHYKRDSFFRAMADSALRAVYKCSPLQGLPRDQHAIWGEMELVFDPKNMF